jgi:hypothetical protein
MSRGPDAGTLLARALIAAAQADGITLTIVDSDWTHWASATFAGAQHRFSVAGPASAALDDWLTELPERDFALRGHLVADLTIVAMRCSADRIEVEIQALTVENR